MIYLTSVPMAIDSIWFRQAAWCLQGFTTVYYCIFSVVIYVYLGSTVQSPALLSLPPKWAKAAFAIGLGNFLLCVYRSHRAPSVSWIER